jgi:hypothetical protein
MKKAKIEKEVEKTVTFRQIYTIQYTEYSDGSRTLNRTNDGFNALELMGALETAQRDIRQQMLGLIKPDVVKRTVIVD